MGDAWPRPPLGPTSSPSVRSVESNQQWRMMAPAMLLKYMLFSEIPIFDPLYRNSVGGFQTIRPVIATSRTMPATNRLKEPYLYTKW
jgi:hypothetical protein